MNSTNQKMPRVVPFGDGWAVHVPGGRGEELRHHLAAHAVRARLSTVSAGPEYEVLVVEGGADPISLQALVDHWER